MLELISKCALLDGEGKGIRIGDTVFFDNGKTPREIAATGVEEIAIMIESKPLGLIFVPASIFVDDEVQVIRNGRATNRDKH